MGEQRRVYARLPWQPFFAGEFKHGKKERGTEVGALN